MSVVVKCSISIFCRASGNFLFRNANLCTLASRRLEMQVLFTVQGREGSLITLLTLGGGESDELLLRKPLFGLLLFHDGSATVKKITNRCITITQDCTQANK